MKIKLGAILLVIAMCVGFTSCNSNESDLSSSTGNNSPQNVSSSNEPENESSSNGTETKNITFPLEEEVTLRIWMPYSNTLIDSMEDNEVVGMIEEKLGINLEFIHPSQADEETSLQVLFTSSELPDIIRLDDGGQSATLKYPGGGEKGVADGIILQLNDLIDQYAPNYQIVRERGGEYEKNTITDSGIMWAMYTMGDIYEMPWNGLSYRKDWADDMGLEAPVTLDDWHEILTAFKEEKGADAPLMIPDDGIMVSSEFLSAFDTAKDFYVVNGDIKYGYLEAGMKEYVEMMQKWYSEGLIDPEFAANEEFFDAGNGYGLPITYAVSGRTGAGVINWPSSRNGLSVMYRATDDESIDFYPVVPPVKTEGDVTCYRYTTSPIYNPWIVTTSCENPEIAVKFLDWGFSDEGSLVMNFGSEDNYTITDDGPWFIDDILYSEEHDLPTFLGAHTWEMLPGLRNIERAFQNTDSFFLSTRDVWSSANNDYVIPAGVELSAEEGVEHAAIMADINKYVKEVVPKYIMGSIPMEDWDGVVEQLKSMNIDRAIEIQQAVYDRYSKR